MSDLHDKINELTARMLTCAAHITVLMSHNRDDDLITVNPPLVIDAGNLLAEAAAMLKSFQPAQEPMEIIPPQPKDFTIDRSKSPVWDGLTFHDPGPPLLPNKPSPRACPKCDSRAAKTVRRFNKAFMLECPVCGELWPYTKPSWI